MSISGRKSKENAFSESGTSPTLEYSDVSSHRALNIAQAAIYAGVKCSAIEEVVRDGKLRGRRLGRHIIILRHDLDAFLESLEVIAPHTPKSILKRRLARQPLAHGRRSA